MAQTYMDAKQVHSPNQKGVYLIGFGFDGTACFRKGTKHGPSAIRENSFGIESYSPYLHLDLEDYSHFYDLGDLPVIEEENQEKVWAHANQAFYKFFEGIKLEEKKIRILTLGGEHSISYAPIKTYLEQYPNLVLLHLDAHADLRDGYEGYHYSHASIIRRALDHFTDDHQLIQYGIRSGTKEEYDWMKDHKTLCTSLESFIDLVKAIPQDRPIYMTLDLDYFDPSFFPGTGTPEPGGETFHSFVKLIKVLREKNFVGADITELSPEIDSSGNSSVFATKVVREVMLVLGEKL